MGKVEKKKGTAKAEDKKMWPDILQGMLEVIYSISHLEAEMVRKQEGIHFHAIQ